MQKGKWSLIKGKKIKWVHLFLYLFLVVTGFSCLQPPEGTATTDKNNEEKLFEKASINGGQANEGFRRSKNYMDAWLSYADLETKLIPRNLDSKTGIWNAQDCAADNYPFLVLTSYFTDQDLFNGLMPEMLKTEIRVTSRVKSLPDTYSFAKQGFEYEEVSMDRIIFGTAEYMKDGLLPLTEYLGHSPWSERMLTMLQDLDEYVDVATFSEEGFGKAPKAEVNGELLQVLSRVYWMTGDKKFLKWAIQIGDHFLLGEGYPLTSMDYLKLRDHGCELVSGLCELYVTLHYADKEKKQSYQKPLYKLLDFILEKGRNDDGLFYNAINPQTGEVVEQDPADTWGYTLNGYYAVYMVDSVKAYKEAVTRIFENLHKYRNFNWENNGADGFADAIEGAINLYNRIPDKRVADWIDSEIKVMWSLQDSSHRQNARQWQNTGIIEGWYGDGNFARTSIMHNLWKSKGTYLQPWNPEVSIGAEMVADTLFMAVRSSEAWRGKLHFDKARHKELKLPVDWPRINQFPEWFTVDPSAEYQLIDNRDGSTQVFSGQSLLDGIEINLQADQEKWLKLYKHAPSTAVTKKTF